jgi:tRNA threonylcarbamoyladenosine biosynthesis protein TsaE
MLHRSDHNQPSEKSHWGAQLEDPEATARLGARFASCIKPGMRLYFRGELGSGKSTLIRGLLVALGVTGRIKSPTYTLVELYVVSRLNLYHFDLYRFMNEREFSDAGLADYFEGEGVCLVEWPERAGGALPRPDLEFTLAYAGSGRAISVHAHGKPGEQCLERLRES